MANTILLRRLAEWIGEAKVWAKRGPELGCSDCPIVMSCGLEPSERCLPRLEAIAAGRRRQVGLHDTGIMVGQR